MAPLVHVDVAGNVGGPVGLWRDHGHGAPVGQLGSEHVTVEGLVRQQGGEVEIRQKWGDPDTIVPLAR
jgi:hypothetical protein